LQTRKQLSKVVCKECKTRVWALNNLWGRNLLGWYKADEEYWSQGTVFCPAVGWQESNNSIPEKCPLLLEHIVLLEEGE